MKPGSEAMQITRQAIAALLQGQEPEGISRQACGQWWPIVNRLIQMRDDGGVEQVRAGCRRLAHVNPHLARMLEHLPIEEPAPGTVRRTNVRPRPLRWIVPSLLPEGITILTSAPKLGKSWLCLDLAVAVASGKTALGRIAVEQGDVLYLALEHTTRRLQRRFDTFLGYDLLPPALSFVTRDYMPQVWADSGRTHIARWLEAHPTARLVIIDSIQTFRPDDQPTTDLHAYDAHIKELADLARTYRIALLIVHHIHDLPLPGTLQAFGTTWAAKSEVNCALVLERERGASNAELQVMGRDVHNLAVALAWDNATTHWSILGMTRHTSSTAH